MSRRRAKVEPEPDLRDAVLRPIRDRNVFEATVEQLASAVRLGVLADGERLPPERELAARLGVSRMTLRDAIAALRESGLAQTQPGRGGGTVVTYDGPAPVRRRRLPAILADHLGDTLDFRRVVEPGAAYLAAGRAAAGARSPDEVDWLRGLEHDVRATSGDRSAHRLADSRLHLAVATLTGSPTLIESVTRAQESLRELLSYIPVLPRNIEHSHQQHHATVAAIVAGRPEDARAAMEEHCDATSALLRGLT